MSAVSTAAGRPPRLPPVYRRLFLALDALLEDGVPRHALAAAGMDTAHVAEWTRLWALAEDVAGALAPRWSARRRAGPPLAPDAPELVRLVVISAALAGLARVAALPPAAAPALVELQVAVEATYGYARRARDPRVRAALRDALASVAA